MNKDARRIKTIEPGSIAEELELSPGDIILSINGTTIEDIFDYRFLIMDEELVMEVETAAGELWELEIEKEFDEDLGIEFENGLMDDYRSCTNKCIFCFIDQMPPGMRETLYFKDDDSRLSFLTGNYITLTNLKEKDVDRIIRYRMEPINISVHTTNPELRCMMLHNRFAGESLKLLDRFKEAEIMMNGQIVLVKGVNDGKELERTIEDLMKYMPLMESVSIVPIGLTKYREGLFEAVPFEKEDAKKVIETVKHYQKLCMEKAGIHFIHASDEWYILAEEDMPPEESYDGYLQLENGVGMITLLRNEFYDALEVCNKKLKKERTVSIVTGKLAAPLMQELSDAAMEKFPKLKVNVYPIENRFFGELITVSGLLTAQDILAQLEGKELGDKLLLPGSLMKRDEELFLDDMTLDEFKEAVKTKVGIVSSEGESLLTEMIN